MIIGILIALVVIGMILLLIKTAPEYEEAENGTLIKTDKPKNKKKNLIL